MKFFPPIYGSCIGRCHTIRSVRYLCDEKPNQSGVAAWRKRVCPGAFGSADPGVSALGQERGSPEPIVSSIDPSS